MKNLDARWRNSSTTETLPEGSPEIDQAIAEVRQRLVESILRTVRHALTDIPSFHEALDNLRPLENEALGIGLEGQLALIESHASQYEISIGAVSPDSIRSRIQQLADAIVLREGRAQAHTEADRLEVFLTRHGAELAELLPTNPFEHLAHEEECREEDALLYLYKVDGETVEVWQFLDPEGRPSCFLLRGDEAAEQEDRFESFEEIREWSEDDFRLQLFDTGRLDGRGQTKLAYRFFDGGQLIFEGEDFAGSPLHADDSDATLASLLGFLSLRPGDTDAEYFDSYTPERLAWCEERAEDLGLHSYELEMGSRFHLDP